MTKASKRELSPVFAAKYRRAGRSARTQLLDEFCELTGYHRKYAIVLLQQRTTVTRPPRAPRERTYDGELVAVLMKIWEAAGYPWSVRLKALLPLWLPWAKQHLLIAPSQEVQLLQMSPSTMDRALRSYKDRLLRRNYGRTKPGTLLKHHFKIRTDNWDIHEAGFGEIDLVAHCGNMAYGEFINSLNFTDIATTWTETRAVLGKGQRHVCEAINEITTVLPFPLKGLDSDNGSEFINMHLLRYCKEKGIQLTRGRPYKKNDNAHIEQKNWTHVRKLLGWQRYDTAAVLEAINDLYRNELGWWMNYFQPTVKLLRKERLGSKVKRIYDQPRTPLDRVVESANVTKATKAALLRHRKSLDPFVLAAQIDVKLRSIVALANLEVGPPARLPASLRFGQIGSLSRRQAAEKEEAQTGVAAGKILVGASR